VDGMGVVRGWNRNPVGMGGERTKSGWGRVEMEMKSARTGVISVTVQDHNPVLYLQGGQHWVVSMSHPAPRSFSCYLYIL